MKIPPTLILNTSILTAYGEYKYEEIMLWEAQLLIGSNFISAIGHEATAQILSELLSTEAYPVHVPVNRIQAEQQVGQPALVFKVNGRLPEGVILDREQLEKIGYSLGWLFRTA